MNGRTFQSVLRAVEKLSPGWVKKFHYELFLRSPGGSDPQNEVDEAIAFLKTANLSKDQMKRFLDVCCSKTLQYYPPLPLEKEEECCSTKTES